MAKTNFNMQITDTQKDIMDFITDVVFFDQISKAGVVMELFREKAYSYLNFPDDTNLSDEMILSALLSNKREEDSRLIGVIGTLQYRKLIDEYKQKYVDGDSSYMEKLLEEYISKYGECDKSQEQQSLKEQFSSKNEEGDK